MTHGSDLFSVSRSSRALQDTRSSTLQTQVAGPLRLVAGEVASWTSFILARCKRSCCQPGKQCDVRPLTQLRGVGGWWGDVPVSGGSSARTWHHSHRSRLTWCGCHGKRTEIPVESLGNQTRAELLVAVRCIPLWGTSSHLCDDDRQSMKVVGRCFYQTLDQTPGKRNWSKSDASSF